MPGRALTGFPGSHQCVWPDETSRLGVSRDLEERRVGEAEAEPQHKPRRLDRDAPGHLRLAAGAVREHDRYLGEAEARLRARVVDLDLERVAIRPESRQIEQLDGRALEALEPARAIADRDAEKESRVEATALADEVAEGATSSPRGRPARCESRRPHRRYPRRRSAATRPQAGGSSRRPSRARGRTDGRART